MKVSEHDQPGEGVADEGAEAVDASAEVSACMLHGGACSKRNQPPGPARMVDG
jgi:hypothetical protein